MAVVIAVAHSMLGKYADASSSSMINLENGLRNRALYHQNMMGMNLMAEFYHNPPSLSNPSVSSGGGGGAGVGAVSMMSQSQKMLNSLSVSAGNVLQSQHTGNAPVVTTVAIGAAPTTSSSASQQPLAQLQCQLCQKYCISGTVLAQHMKTHENDYLPAREEVGPSGGYSQQQSIPSASSLVTAVASSSKTSPPLLTQHSIKSEYIGGNATATAVSLAVGAGQFSPAYGITKQFDCHICHKSFMTMMNLNLHMKIHEELKSAAASHIYSHAAGATTTTSNNFHHHHHHQHQNHHNNNPQQQQQQQHIPMLGSSIGATVNDGSCQICHKTFSTVEQFTAHMKIHENEFKNRALYHSGSSNAVGSSSSSSSVVHSVTTPTTTAGTDPFYPATQPLQILAPQTPAPQLDATKGHRCPICHKMSNNIIEHIKQHEGQLTMGDGGANSRSGTAPSPPGVVGSPGGATTAVYPQLNEDSQSSLEGDDSEGQAGEGPESRKHECLICRKKFSSSGNLAIHIRVHSGEKPFKCTVCGKGFIQSNNLATHMKTHTGEKPYACTICGKNFSQSNNLKTHIRTHTGEKPYACTICGKRFNQKNNLTTHMRTHQLVCMVCGVQFMHPSDLANHMKFHNDEKPYICSVCNKVYLNLDELTEHMKKTHNQVKPYRCHICDKTFTQSNNLKTHIKTHIFQDPYKCQMCSRSFQKEDDYSQHMLVHTADKPYECTYCGKRFIQSNNLKTHVRTHTGEKPYRCSICAKLFNQKNNLNTHMRIHTGEKPFECTICDKRFNQSNNLNKHIKTHGQEKDEQQHAS
uniref:C2H2-type domain-containing protein n=2 Tax=Anopheles atroparvus TaxID=41427 RepID=A0A182IQC6_ANOAO